MTCAPTFQCHRCLRLIKGRLDRSGGATDGCYRLAQHKEPDDGDGYRPWCHGSGELAEYDAC